MMEGGVKGSDTHVFPTCSCVWRHGEIACMASSMHHQKLARAGCAALIVQYEFPNRGCSIAPLRNNTHDPAWGSRDALAPTHFGAAVASGPSWLSHTHQIQKLAVTCGEMILEDIEQPNAIDALRAVWLHREQPHLQAVWEGISTRFWRLATNCRELQLVMEQIAATSK